MQITLATLIDIVQEDSEVLEQILSSFSCEQDEDIEYFLHNHAVEFERLDKAKTYLICDEDQIAQENFYINDLIIYGYISLALKVLTVPEETSNRARAKIDGLSGKIHGKPIKDFPCYLIGQLARNSKVPKESLSGKELLDWAYDHIKASVDEVGGRYMMIECREKPELIKFYSDNGFDELTRESDGTHVQVQMIRKI